MGSVVQRVHAVQKLPAKHSSNSVKAYFADTQTGILKQMVFAEFQLKQVNLSYGVDQSSMRQSISLDNKLITRQCTQSSTSSLSKLA